MYTNSVRSITITKLFVLPLLALLGCGPVSESEEVAGEILMAGPVGGAGGTGAGSRYMNRPPAAQSSTDWLGHPDRATDGNTDGDYNNGSVTHTAYQMNPWWEVPTAPQNPEAVTIYNRTDCCGERLGSFMLWFWRGRYRDWIKTGPFDMGDRDRMTVYVPADNNWGTVDAVRVIKQGEGYLSLAEVVVLGR